VSGEVITPYRNGTDPYASGQHRGIDIAASAGTPVRAAAPGDVLFAGTAGSSGLTISIRTTDGYDTSYLHLSSLVVRVGARVGAGDRIGAVGTTGRRSATQPHLHFGARDAGTRHGYHDPLAFLPPAAGTPRSPGAPPAAAPEPAPAPPAAAPAPVPRSAPAAQPAPTARPAPRRAPAPRHAPHTAPAPRHAPHTAPVPRHAPRAAPVHAPAHAPGHAPGPSHALRAMPRPADAPRALIGRGDSMAALGRPDPTRAALGPAHWPRLTPRPLDPRAAPGSRHAPHGVGAAAGAPNAAHSPAAATAATPAPQPAHPRGAEPSGRPDIGWALASAGLLLAAGILGLTNRGGRSTSRSRTRVLRGHRAVLGRR
jgi:hypothetical protein